MSSARWKLVSLWLSQFARVTADNALRFFVFVGYASQNAAQRENSWYLLTALFFCPAIVLAPVNGALSNCLPKSQVLKATALVGLLVTGLFAFTDGPWFWGWGLLTIVSAIDGPVRSAMLPAASVDTRWSLTRINGLFGMGAALAVLGGMFLIARGNGLENMEHASVAIFLIVVLHGIALVAALPVNFPSDVRRAEPALQAMHGFYTDLKRIWSERDARLYLLTHSGLTGLVVAIAGALVPSVLDGDSLNRGKIVVIGGWFLAGVAIGSLLAGVQKHPRRVLGFVAWGFLGLSVTLVWIASIGVAGEWTCAILGIMVGLITVPLATGYQIALPPDARGNGMALRNMTDYLLALAAAMPLLLAHRAGIEPTAQLWVIVGIAWIATISAWWFFRREVVEQMLELPFAIMYRFHVAGPGLETFPLRGPVVVVANHSAWMDPIWLGKVLPRSLVPMMTSLFFDHPLLRWIMVYIVDAVRVENLYFRREVPELKTAVGVLDAGQCLVIFPEGRLRRSDDQPLKLFGQGVWHILHDRPNTPVVVCWIEGGWGSFFSYVNGPPTRNKRFDIARSLSVAVGEPHVLGPEILADHRKTREYLMEQCGQTRKYLGLEPVILQPFHFEELENEL